jgi:hypothetical protein
MFRMIKIVPYIISLCFIGAITGSSSIYARSIPAVYAHNLLVVLDESTGAGKSEKNADTSTQASDRKEKKLKTLIEGEAKRQGLMTGIMSGVVFLYSSVSDLLLHPVLTIVLSTLTLGLIALGVFIIVLLRREDFSAFGKLVSFGILYFLLYIDLLFIIYEQRRITMMFFRLDKDILLVVLATIVGYFVGRYSSRKVFEEKVLP